MTEATLKAKYELEREKRLRPDGSKQYVDFRTPQFAHLNQDPWVDYNVIAAQEPALKDGEEIKLLVVGAGHAGLTFAYRAFEIGIAGSDICVVDVAGGPGGTWYWNRYPGLMCDVEGYIYLPMLEETGYVPKHRYSYGAEIRGQSERIVANIGCKTIFSTKVDRLEWNEKAAGWIVTLTQDRGPKHRQLTFKVQAQFVFTSTGSFFVPRIPKSPGFEAFEKRNQIFHTSRWNYHATGGSQENPALTSLENKRVAVVGTGATAVQVVPEVAKWAKHLFVVQRTPSYVGARNQKETDPTEWKVITSFRGWQHRRRENFDHFITNDPVSPDLVNDGWTDTRAFTGVVGGRKIITKDTLQEHIDSLFQLDIPRSEAIRKHIDRQVDDKATAEKLKPWYSGWCKRPTFHDDYLKTFNKPNVTLIDTSGKGLEGYTEIGILAQGIEYEIDVVILATGFSLARSQQTGPEEGIGATVIGRNGRSLGDKWTSPEVGSLFGIMTEGFPNLFFAGLTGGPSSPNLSSAYDLTARLSTFVIKTASEKTGRSHKLIIEPEKAAEERYSQEVVKRALYYSVLSTCTPGYFNRDGGTEELKPSDARKASWGQGIVSYKEMSEAYQQDDKLQGFELR